METGKQDVPGKRLSLVEAFADLPEPRVAGRSKHDLVEILVVAVCALVCGVDDSVGIEAWANVLAVSNFRRNLAAVNGGAIWRGGVVTA